MGDGRGTGEPIHQLVEAFEHVEVDRGSVTGPGRQIDAGDEKDDIFVTHHSATGTEIDTFQLSLDTGKIERCYAIVVDSGGNVFIGGEAEVSGSEYDGFVRRLDPEGNVTWTLDHDGGANGRDGVQALAVDEGDAVWVCGYEEVAGEDQNVWVTKHLPPAP